MEYIKGNPYFCFVDSQLKGYPYLKEDITCDVLIIGGGIDGAIANFYLSQEFDVVLVDKSRIGYACITCATALLEYQLDDFASDIKEYIPEEDIVKAYKMGLESLNRIENFVSKYGNECQFSRRPTFLYTKKKSNNKDLEEEYTFRNNNGLKCKLLTKDSNPFPFPIESGIFCENGGGEFNPYLFTKQMIENSSNQDRIYENTHIVRIMKDGDRRIAITSFGEKITCKKIIVATGFNWEFLNKTDLCERFISYSIVTEPIKGFGWHKNALIHDVEEPYHYLRMLPDNRIIFGSEDTTFKEKPIDENLANKKYDKLTEDLFELFPEIKDAKIDFKFCGSFGTTNDNLGLIGTSAWDDNILLFISCGANGIINAMSGVDVLIDTIKGKSNDLTSLFSPRRESLKS